MISRHVLIPGVPDEVVRGLHILQGELGLPEEFPPAALEQAEALRSNPPDFPDHADRTSLGFITIDPASSMDLDQAMHIERDGDGYVVHYAIADVAAWVAPDSAIAAEAWERGQTKYAPGAKVALHPPALSEDAASLLADGRPRPAMLWTHRVDATGVVVGTTLERAMVVNRAKLSYEDVAAQLSSSDPSETALLLAEVGRLLVAQEVERGGVNLNLPDQEIVSENGTWRLEFRSMLDVEEWNAQISLMTGIAAARMMVAGKVGILRTLPPAEESAIAKLRRVSASLDVPWPADLPYPDFVRDLDPSKPEELAVIVKCTSLFRGAGYVAFHGELPDKDLRHAAVASLYAHATAPLRRLVDRFVLETCHSLSTGVPVPSWVIEALDGLPAVMQETGQKANAYERGVIDLAEALVLAKCVGRVYDAVVIDVNPRTGSGTVQITEFAIEARIGDTNKNLVGKAVRVRLDGVDLVQGNVHFSIESATDESAR